MLPTTGMGWEGSLEGGTAIAIGRGVAVVQVLLVSL